MEEPSCDGQEGLVYSPAGMSMAHSPPPPPHSPPAGAHGGGKMKQPSRKKSTASTDEEDDISNIPSLQMRIQIIKQRVGIYFGGFFGSSSKFWRFFLLLLFDNFFYQIF